MLTPALFVEQRGQLWNNYRNFPPFISSACWKVVAEEEQEEERGWGATLRISVTDEWKVDGSSLLVSHGGGGRGQARGQPSRLTRLIDVPEPSCSVEAPASDPETDTELGFPSRRRWRG